MIKLRSCISNIGRKKTKKYVHSMLNSKNLNSLLMEIEKEGADFQAILKDYIRVVVRVAQNSEEIREEARDFDDNYQFFIKNEEGPDFNFWLRISKGKISYHEGINKSTLRLIIDKERLIKMLKRELSATDAYMKGIIQIHGSLTEAMKCRNLLKTFFKYIVVRFSL